MLKLRMTSLLLVIFLLLPSTVVFGQVTPISIDKSQLGNGLIGINYKSSKNIATKVTITKGNIKYTYDLKSNNQFPLQLGDGEYVIAILENISGNKYRVIEKEKVNLKLADKNKVFLQSIQIINWNEDMNAVNKARELTVNAKNDGEKVTAIYNYIISNYKYDYNKVNKINDDYIPSIEETMEASKGICYDYSALFAGMLRSVGVPAKLIMGYKKDVKTYHAWNQIYLKDINKWITIDTTYDSIKNSNQEAVSMIKNEKDYSIERQY